MIFSFAENQRTAFDEDETFQSSICGSNMTDVVFLLVAIPSRQ